MLSLSKHGVGFFNGLLSHRVWGGRRSAPDDPGLVELLRDERVNVIACVQPFPVPLPASSPASAMPTRRCGVSARACGRAVFVSSRLDEFEALFAAA